MSTKNTVEGLKVKPDTRSQCIKVLQGRIDNPWGGFSRVSQRYDRE